MVRRDARYVAVEIFVVFVAFVESYAKVSELKKAREWREKKRERVFDLKWRKTKIPRITTNKIELCLYQRVVLTLDFKLYYLHFLPNCRVEGAIEL